MANDCTGSAVSTSTAITASHCLIHGGDAIDENTGRVETKKTYCISNAVYNNVCSSELYYNPEYTTDKSKDWAYVVFPKGTFKSYFRVNQAPVKQSDQVVLIGYSEDDLPRGQKPKRFGYNKINRIEPAPSNRIVTYTGSNFNAVGIGHGDSGGPMLKDCQITGLASAGDDKLHPTPLYHTNLTNPAIASKLKAIKNAYFCGLSGDDETFSPKSLA